MKSNTRQSLTIGVLVGVVLSVAAILAVLFLVLPRTALDQLLIKSGFDEGTPERHVLPEGLQGWVFVRYGVQGRPELPMEDGVLVFRYPASGRLETSSSFGSGVKLKHFEVAGAEGPVPLPRDGPGRRVWKEHDVAIGDEQGEVVEERYSGFFVGTEAQLEQAGPLCLPQASSGGGRAPGIPE